MASENSIVNDIIRTSSSSKEALVRIAEFYNGGRVPISSDILKVISNLSLGDIEAIKHSDLNLDDGNNPHGTSYSDLLGTPPSATGYHNELILNDGSNPHGTSKLDVGLGNVDNTSDINKPISTATQTALNTKVGNERVLTDVPSGALFTDTEYDDTPVTNHINDLNNPHQVTKAQVGLSNVDNVADVNKPVSNATVTALADKADSSQVLTDVPAGAVFTDTIYDSSTVDSHITATTNPHSTTKAHVGLALADNTSDANKPVSIAVAAELSTIKNVYGWGVYTDGEVTNPTQVFTTTPAPLLIDGEGATSENSYLPLEIRGQSELWDTVNNKILPIAIGDTYTVRINLNLTSKTGSPTLLDVALDIGTGDDITIRILSTAILIPKSPPFLTTFNLSIFSLNTFLTNGGRIFISTDTGTVTADVRQIFITRTTANVI